jgi:arachidonate 15-lipoxygenase
MPTPYLPSQDPDPAKRNQRLLQQQKSYQYDRRDEDDPLSVLALLKEVPTIENFSSQYITERLVASSELLPNMLAAKARAFFDPLDELQDYEDLFTVIPLPAVAKVYQTNDSFAEQRLSGPNPLVIRLLDHNDPRARILEDIPSFKQDFEPKFDVLKELGNNNIFVTDYTGTDNNYRGPSLVQGGTDEKGKRKYLPKPLAFFRWKRTGDRDLGKLVPVAIQLNTITGNRVYTPFEKNPLDWLFAKFCVQIADGNHHEMNSHLCRTHFVMEPFAIATARQLSVNHPLNILLRPHFMFMLANNHLGQEKLINRGGPVDELLAGTLEESMELVKDAYETWNFNDFAFPKDIENRGMGNIPHYPYRDDGMLVWAAIHTFVAGYLNFFYPNSELITGDNELQAWASELSDQTNGGKVKGMRSHIATVDELIEIVTTVIFICGPQHSVVNFAQQEYMSFAANMPLAAYQNPDESGDTNQTKIMALLPPYKRAADQLQSLFVLAAYRYDRLGYYDKTFKDFYNQKLEDVFTGENDRIVEIVRQFQQDLAEVERKIDMNNQKRIVPFLYLKPSLILNSISI